MLGGRLLFAHGSEDPSSREALIGLCNATYALGFTDEQVERASQTAQLFLSTALDRMRWNQSIFAGGVAHPRCVPWSEEQPFGVVFDSEDLMESFVMERAGRRNEMLVRASCGSSDEPTNVSTSFSAPIDCIQAHCNDAYTMCASSAGCTAALDCIEGCMGKATCTAQCAVSSLGNQSLMDSITCGLQSGCFSGATFNKPPRRMQGDESHIDKSNDGCKDTAGFVNPYGYDCAAYANQWCDGGKARTGSEWTLGSRYRYPEENCCVCGKSLSKKMGSKGDKGGKGGKGGSQNFNLGCIVAEAVLNQYTGVVLTGAKPNWQYTIRTNTTQFSGRGSSSVGGGLTTNMPSTTTLLKPFQAGASDGWQGYAVSGFLWLETTINGELISQSGALKQDGAGHYAAFATPE